MSNTITRADYMAGKVTHAEYYRAVAKTAGVSYRNANPKFLGRVRRALAEGDEHLNTIPLHEWDARGAWISGAGRAFKAHGGFASMAGLVCLVKTAACDAANAGTA